MIKKTFITNGHKEGDVRYDSVLRAIMIVYDVTFSVP